MTYLEKLKELFPNIKENDFVTHVCPALLGLEKSKKCLSVSNCAECWNREMPGTEAKVDGIPVIPQSEVDAYNKGHADGVAQGLSDSSDAVIALINLSSDEREEIFAYSSSEYVIKNFTMKDIIAKLKVYEEAQEIKVGNVVETNSGDVKLLVTAISRDEAHFDGIKVTPTDEYGKLGATYSGMTKTNFKKTGEHIDLQSILSQIGGE